MAKIGFQNGIRAVSDLLRDKFPGHRRGITKFQETQNELVKGHNSTIDRLNQLEGVVNNLPFLPPPASS